MTIDVCRCDAGVQSAHHLLEKREVVSCHYSQMPRRVQVGLPSACSGMCFQRMRWTNHHQTCRTLPTIQLRQSCMKALGAAPPSQPDAPA